MPARRAFTATLAVWACRKQEVAWETARRCARPLWRVTVKRDGIPPALRVQTPSQMRDRIGILVAFKLFAALQPFAHQRGIGPAFDRDNMPVLDVQMDRVRHIAAIGQDHDITRHDHHFATCRTLVGEGVDQTHTPMVEATGFISHAILDHHRIFAARIA